MLVSYVIRRKGGYLWWFEGIVCGKVNREEKHTAGIWTVALQHTRQHTIHTKERDIKGGVYRSHDSCLPVEL